MIEMMPIWVWLQIITIIILLACLFLIARLFKEPFCRPKDEDSIFIVPGKTKEVTITGSAGGSGHRSNMVAAGQEIDFEKLTPKVKSVRTKKRSGL